MTRAKEKLILTGLLKDAEGKCDGWEKALPESMDANEKLPVPLIAGSESFLELLYSAYKAGGDKESISVRFLNCSDLIWNEMEAQSRLGLSRQELDMAGEITDAPLPDPEFARKLEEIYSRRYAHEDLGGLYTKTSVSELKAAAMEDEEGEGAFPLFPEILPSPTVASFALPPEAVCDGADESGGSGLTGAQFGTAVHKLLELFDYERFSEPSGITAGEFDEWRRELADAGKIPRSYAEQLPAGGILSFLRSGIAGRMAGAHSGGRLFREQSFVLGIEADMVDPGFPHGETVLVQGIIDA